MKARYVAKPEIEKNTDAILNRLELQDVWSTGTTRGGNDELEAVELELGTGPTEEDSPAGLDETWWTEFDGKLKEHLQDLGFDD